MEVTVTGRQMEMTPALKEYLESRAKKIEKYTSKASQVTFTLKVEKYRHIAEVLVRMNGFMIQAEEETDAMYTSVDKAMSKVERQLKKYKEKICNHRIRHVEPDEEKAPSDTLASKIKKRKKFSVQRMTLEEAVLQMELLGKSFFLFGDLENHLNVLYKRKDGTLGLIEPIYQH